MNIQLTKRYAYDQSIDRQAYLFCACYADLDDIIAGTCRELPFCDALSLTAHQLFQTALIDSLRQCNQGNEVFLSSPLGSENTWQSDFFVGLENFFRLKQLVQEQQDLTLVVLDDAWYLIVLKFLKSLPGCRVVYSKKEAIYAHLSKIKLRASQSYRLYYAFKDMYQRSLPFAHTLKKIKNTHQIIFATVWSGPNILSFLNTKRDPYFNNIPFLLQEHGLEPAIFSHIDRIDAKKLSDFCQIQSLSVYSYFSLLRLKDLIEIAIQLLCSSVRIPSEYQWLKIGIQEDMQQKKWIQSCQTLMVKAALMRFLKVNPQARVVHMYEGNCWEKGCAMASRQLKQPSIVLGYQHTGLSRAYPKLRCNAQFMPDLVFTTGEGTRKILIQEFEHLEDRVIASCALRQEGIYAYTPRSAFPETIHKILVLLQGSPCDRKLMQRVVALQKEYSGLIVVRQHPAYPIPGIDAMPRIIMSQEPNLYQEVLTADLIFYHGTTAALEAAFLGVPCMFIDIGIVPLADPLFQIQDNILVQRLGHSDHFSAVISTMLKKRGHYAQDLQRMRDYFLQYFDRASESKKLQFIDRILGK